MHNNRKALTVRTYISAIKAVLDMVDQEVNEDRTTLNALIKACCLSNHRIEVKFPIRKGLLGLIVKQMETQFITQPFLEALYKALFTTAYFGLFHIGEITYSDHVVKAVDVHIGVNKPKLMFVLHSSKTHTEGQKPQIIKISAIQNKRHSSHGLGHICPFILLQNYLQV